MKTMIMKRKKLKLDELKVKSFVTGVDRNKVDTVKGGWTYLLKLFSVEQVGCIALTDFTEPSLTCTSDTDMETHHSC